jgi:uncharacterized membrane protein YeaQ/YmgE (transglycosylase-associated protein family)
VEAIAYVIALVFNGLIVGALGRLVVPGRDPMSILQTILVGIAASLAGGLVTYYAFDESAWAGFLIALLCAAALVFAIRKFRERQLGSAAATRPRGSSSALNQGVQVRTMPGCLVGSLVASLILTVLLNLLIRAF